MCLWLCVCDCVSVIVFVVVSDCVFVVVFWLRLGSAQRARELAVSSRLRTAWRGAQPPGRCGPGKERPSQLRSGGEHYQPRLAVEDDVLVTPPRSLARVAQLETIRLSGCGHPAQSWRVW